MRVVLVTCAVCHGPYAAMRDHCPYCNAKRAFIACGYTAAKPFYHYHVETKHTDNGIELVRAKQSSICSDERAILASPCYVWSE